MERIIIDTDPGVDDAQAILMASAHPGCKIEALTVVAGNVGLKHTLPNALTIVEVIGQDIPVYKGCDRPLVQFQEDAAFAHGTDGLGDCGLLPRERQAEDEDPAGDLQPRARDPRQLEDQRAGHREDDEDDAAHDHGPQRDPAPLARLQLAREAHEHRREARRVHDDEEPEHGHHQSLDSFRQALQQPHRFERSR